MENLDMMENLVSSLFIKNMTNMLLSFLHERLCNSMLSVHLLITFSKACKEKCGEQ